MSRVEIDDKLASLVQRLSALRIATPISNPNYKKITEQYREASDRQTAAIGKAIDDADKDYLDFSKAMNAAITSINEALENIKKVAQTIERIAKVLDVLGKVFEKLTVV
ncbi:MAG: hypothetical protein A4E71_02512 [Smithella sp. PtaU1.Bin162]|nr:MAG: hypothetical protein A4E71_02512 [Smithella sp. PtaU1.Bin162]